MKQMIFTNQAPAAIGTYSQAIKAGNTVYISGQIPLDPQTNELLKGDFAQQVHQVFKNLQAIAEGAGGHLSQVVKLTVYLTNINNFSIVNQVMSEYFQTPYPARVLIEVGKLPKAAVVEIDAIMALGE
jgi:reactive intermediate/imine deaminase